MLFNSYLFLFLFLPLCLVGFYILKSKHATLAKVWLICFSLWFYGYFNFSYLLIMLGSIGGNYIIHKYMLYSSEKQRKNMDKILLMLGISGNIVLLFYYKYFDFFIININKLWNTGLMVKGILLPLGISFFTFQQISFLVDSYKGEMKKCNFVDYTLFVSFFPQLVAGPIERSKNLLKQLAIPPKFNVDNVIEGAWLMLWGYFLKVVLADRVAIFVDPVYAGYEKYTGMYAIVATLLFAVQLYCDFYGYSVIAMGCAKVLGYQLIDNFNAPFLSRSIAELWRRWHISLGSWFRDYVYIPLGGSRVGKLRGLFNIFVVWMLTGFWHGADWNFILWGLFFAT